MTTGVTTIQPRAEVPWLSYALHELGTRETPGPRSTLRINEYHAVTAAGVPARGDETPWCAAFVCWCLEQAKVRHTRSKSARSFEAWGQVVEPSRGAITVLSRGLAPQDGHVGFLVHWDVDDVWLCGGNQGNAVTVARYPRRRVVGFRLPAGYLEVA